LHSRLNTISELIAYHEAGHALMALLLGGKVRQVTLDPDNREKVESAPTRSTEIRWGRSESGASLVAVGDSKPGAHQDEVLD
jgi:hypothetical protein